MADKIILKVDKRTLEGKKVKTLRKTGILPANVFGKAFTSASIQLPLLEFQKVLKIAGETHLIDLHLGDKSINVLISNIQVDPVTSLIVHVDFQAVSLKEKITATVPIKIVGESPAEKETIGILVQQLSEVEVEALPTDLPDHLEADISTLAAVGDNLHVKDLKYDKTTVNIKPEDLEKIVCKVEPPAKEEVVEAPVVAEVPVTPDGTAPAAEPAPETPAKPSSKPE